MPTPRVCAARVPTVTSTPPADWHRPPARRSRRGKPGSTMVETSSDKHDQPVADQQAKIAATQIRLLAIAAAARFHGAELDRGEVPVSPEAPPPTAALVEWARQGGLWAKAVRLGWKQLVGRDLAGPIVLLLNDGGAFLLLATNRKRNRVSIRHSRLAPTEFRRSPWTRRSSPRSGPARPSCCAPSARRGTRRRPSPSAGSSAWSAWSAAPCATSASPRWC